MKERLMYTQAAKDLLKDAGYYTDTLYSIYDVGYVCTPAQAQQVLKVAFNNEATTDQIQLSIEYAAEDLGLFKIIS